VQAKHVTAVGFAIIKVVCRLTVLIIANKILYATIISETPAACPEILILFELMEVVISDEDY